MSYVLTVLLSVTEARSLKTKYIKNDYVYFLNVDYHPKWVLQNRCWNVREFSFNAQEKGKTHFIIKE